MEFKISIGRNKAVAEAKKTSQTNTTGTSDIFMKIAQEFQDRSRKDIKKWRSSITAAENSDDPRWFQMQDLIDDLIDSQVASAIDVRKAATLNHRSYVIDSKSNQQLEEQTDFLNKAWFFDFVDAILDAILRKYTVVQFYRNGDNIAFTLIPRRNVCPQLKRVYLEVSGNKFIDYSTENGVIEIIHSSKFGILNDIVPNIIWKRNALQSYAEFTERFGMPLITATTANKADVPRIENALKNLGEAGTGVLPKGSEIIVHNLANAGNPEKTYIENAKFHDNQIVKRLVGSTTLLDEGANRSQTEVHQNTLEDKISLSDKRLITFVVNDKLFPLLQSFGFPFDNTKMKFQFDETEDLSLTEQWKITSDALATYDLDENEVKKTFNLPIIGKNTTPKNTGNFNKATALGAIAVACSVNLPNYGTSISKPNATDSGIEKSLLDELNTFDEQIHKFLYASNTTEAEKQRLQKAKRIAEELRTGLFNGYGDRRIDVNFNAPDNRSLAMMEMNIFQFAESKTRAEVLMLNQLLIDKDKLQIRSENDFIEQAKKINANFNERYLKTERNFAIATGQNSARWFEFIAEKNDISTWIYQTVGDNHVRDEHEILDGLVFSFDDTQARRLWPPNGYECRCEGLQNPNKTAKIESGSDYVSKVFGTDAELKNFAINRADSGVVFAQNQMYLAQLKDSAGNKSVGKEMNKYTFLDYGLSKWKEIRDTLQTLKLDNTITPENVGELFKNNASYKGKAAMGFEDYLKRKVILRESTFKSHTQGKYVSNDERRHQLFAFLNDVMTKPNEVYLRKYAKGDKEQIRYIKFYKDKSIIADCDISNEGLEIKTWYENKIEDEIRTGLLIK